MPLILIHSPKGGVGSTFLTAQIAMHLSARGHQVTAIDFTYQDSLKLHFGMLPNQALVEMSFGGGETMMVSGVDLMTGHALSRTPEFAEAIRLADAPLFDPARITIADVSADDRILKGQLLAHADLHLCTLLPRPASLATLPQVEPGTPVTELTKTMFLLNQLDDRHRLSRHTHSFIRELTRDRLMGSVRRDEAVNEALAMFEPLTKFAPSSVVIPDMTRIAAAIEERLGLVETADQPEVVRS